MLKQINLCELASEDIERMVSSGYSTQPYIEDGLTKRFLRAALRNAEPCAMGCKFNTW
jgi:hypothetical protein